jgi:branched-chain amino acid aminotransferase
LVVCRTTRRNEHSPLARIKSLNYLDSVLARAEAADRGADDGVMLNSVGRAAETTVSNLFVSLQGRWTTPAVAEGALPGIARATILAASRAVEGRLTEDDLARADAALLSNSLALRPVAAIEGRELDIAAAASLAAQIAE